MLFAILVADGVFASGFTLLHDTLNVAEVLRRAHDRAVPEIRVATVAEQPLVRTGSGLAIPTTARLDELAGADVVVVPALGALDESGMVDALDAPTTSRMASALTDLDRSGGQVAAACTGTFVLAEAGLLSGRRATTSWWLHSLFARRYPDTELDPDRMVVKDEEVLTAGAAFAHIDLALTLVRGISVELADRVARHLLIDERATQSMYVPLDHVSHDDQLVRLFERHVRANLAAPLPITTVARALATTPRTLERRVRATANMTPLELIQRIRAERAEHLLATTEQSIDQIALDIGYRNGSTLRALLRKYRRKP
ncbi:helix-turn-helix domain-containing protein [Thermoleophilia bacterium SCSIO 60948]|nr:helix-turn-helix domain-containing protein [Thermoleophilia bacterium SCSIO 60948]